jgi:DNA-binding response OmpR family regulator
MTHFDLLTPTQAHCKEPVALASPSICIIEPHPGIAHMISNMLNLVGYRSSIRETPTFTHISVEDPPSVILLDIHPVRESRSKLLDVQAQCFSIGIIPAIIVLTTSSVLQKEVETLGFRALVKPFHVQDLIRTIHEALSTPFPFHEPLKGEGTQ